MIITHTQLTPYALPLRQQWQGGGSVFELRRGWLLKVECSDGSTGFGDCAPLPSHGTETMAAAENALDTLLLQIQDQTPELALEQLPTPDLNPAARCAVETALLDLLSKQQGLPLHRWLNPESSSKIRVNANIGILDNRTLERAITALEHGYNTLKLKLGSPDTQLELTLLRRLCGNLPDGVKLRLDANRTWDTTAVESYLEQLKHLPIESLEEPLSQPNLDSLRALQELTNITLALDETTAQLSIDDLAQLAPLRRIILKPMAQGGLLPCLLLGQGANELGIETVVTTTVDSAAGVWAATQLAAALDTTGQLCHGLGTSEWLQQDLGVSPEITNGTITIPSTSGLGFTSFS